MPPKKQPKLKQTKGVNIRGNKRNHNVEISLQEGIIVEDVNAVVTIVAENIPPAIEPNSERHQLIQTSANNNSEIVIIGDAQQKLQVAVDTDDNLNCSLRTTSITSNTAEFKPTTVQAAIAIKRRHSLDDSSDEEVPHFRPEIIVDAVIANVYEPQVAILNHQTPNPPIVPFANIQAKQNWDVIEIEPTTVQAATTIKRRHSLDDSSDEEQIPHFRQEIIVDALIANVPESQVAILQDHQTPNPPIVPFANIQAQQNWDVIEIDIPGGPIEPVEPPAIILPEPVLNLAPIIDDQVNNNVNVAEEIQIIQDYVELERRRRHLPTLFRAIARVLPAHHPSSYLGALHHICEHCQARHFACETVRRGHFTTCCHNGKVELPNLTPMPNLLHSLYHGQHRLSNRFKQHILSYNYAFQFVSLEAQLRDLPPGRAPPVYCIQGKIYHHISNINVNNANQRYGPVYFLTPGEAVDQRIGNQGPNVLQVELIQQIETLLREINPYAQAYMHLRERYNVELNNIERLRQNNVNPPPLDVPNIVLELLTIRGRDNRRYDLPAAEEVAAVYRVYPDMPPTPNLRVYIRNQPDRFRTLSYSNELVQPLTFPLLFPYGEIGWHIDIPHVNVRGRVTLCEYYGYRLAIRDGDDRFQYAFKLGQQFVVNAYLDIESNRLHYIRNNQDRLRSEQYVGLADYIQRRIHNQNEPNPEDERAHLGRMVILPSTFIGSPRAQQQNFQDAMAVVCKFGHPSLFITMTANPSWLEITENIPRGQQANNHPMLMSRIFKNKSKMLLQDIIEAHSFGQSIANLAVIEFQKRGLPHMHDLVIMQNQDRIYDTQQIDRLICAEIPDRDTEPELYEKVSKQMVHNPCSELPNAVCKVDGVCSKGFPKEFTDTTIISPEGKVSYRRCNDGKKIMITYAGVRYELDNRWIVPYNPYCLLKYNCHINVEACTTTNSVKYLYKYFFKGTDHALVRIGADYGNGQINYDEIESFLNARYMSAPEASWHILQYSTMMNTHATYRLPVHLPNLQVCRFQPGFEVEALERNETTKLTDWFQLNRRDMDARRYLYIEIPEHYVWKPALKTWSRRQQRGHKIVTRMYSVNMRNQELFCLRILLLHVRGAMSFEDLRTVDGDMCATFLEACQRRNLMADDAEWRRTLDEACHRDLPYQLRCMFAYMLIFCEITDKLALWNDYRGHFIEDFTRNDVAENDAIQRALAHIQSILILNSTNLQDFGLPQPRIIHADDLPIDVAAEHITGTNMRRQLNPEQSIVFDAVWNAIHNENENNRLIFLNAAAGAGKSYVFQTLLTSLRGENILALALAPTGIAASLLKDGRTIHSRFKLPLLINETTVTGVSPRSMNGRLIASAKLIIIDEISMVTRSIFNIVEKALRDICNDNRPFGNKVVLVGGDFRQTLPIVMNNERTQIVDECVKGRLDWYNFKRYDLVTNVRALQGENEFCEWLLQLGNGTLPAFRQTQYGNLIEIPMQCMVASKQQLLDFCLGNLEFNFVSNKVLLTPLNVTCQEINDEVIERLPGPSKTYLSADSIDITDQPDLEYANYSIEFLNSLSPSGFPQHRLILKTGAIIVLLRNLDLKRGLCNGTRLLLRVLGNRYLDAEKIDVNGRLTGERIFIPKIDLISSKATFPFQLRRRQFPIKLAYAMTINKSQGQTFDRIGIYLPTPTFAHD